LVHRANGGAGIVDRWRDGFQGDVHDLQHAKLDILLQGARRAEVESATKIAAVLGSQPIPLGHHEKRDALGNELADSPEQPHFHAA